jgi:hypothetical protein
MDQVRIPLEQPLPLAQRFPYLAKIAVFEIAQSAVNNPG